MIVLFIQATLTLETGHSIKFQFWRMIGFNSQLIDLFGAFVAYESEEFGICYLYQLPGSMARVPIGTTRFSWQLVLRTMLP